MILAQNLPDINKDGSPVFNGRAIFINEHPLKSIETKISIPGSGHTLAYDAFLNRAVELDCTTEQNGLQFFLNLSPYESMIILTGESAQNLLVEKRSTQGTQENNLVGSWTISTSTAEQYPDFDAWKQTEFLFNLSRPDALPTFSGTFRYETNFEWLPNPP